MSGGSRRRNDAVNGGINEADVGFNPGFVFFGEGVKNVTLQLGGAADHVLAGDDIQRGGNPLRLTFGQTFGNRRGDAFQHDRADGGGHQIHAGNQLYNFVADAADGVNAGNGIDLLVLADHVNLIAMTGIQGIKHDLIYIRKRQLYPRVRQQFADKATTDITCAKM